MEEAVAYYKAPSHYFPAGYEENNKYSRPRVDMLVIASCQPLDWTFDTVSTYSARKINRSANVFLPKEQTFQQPRQKLVDVFSVCVCVCVRVCVLYIYI